MDAIVWYTALLALPCYTSRKYLPQTYITRNIPFQETRAQKCTRCYVRIVLALYMHKQAVELHACASQKQRLIN